MIVPRQNTGGATRGDEDMGPSVGQATPHATAVSAPLTFATLNSLNNAITLAYPSGDSNDINSKREHVNAVVTKFASADGKIIRDYKKLDDDLFGKNGVLTESFDDHWQRVAPRDEVGNALNQPPTSEFLAQFKDGKNQGRRGQDSAGYNKWSEDNADFIQIYKNYHNLHNTAKSFVNTSREVAQLVNPTDQKNDPESGASARRAQQRNLVGRVNRCVHEANRAAAVATHFSQSNKTHSWARKAQLEKQAHRRTEVAEAKNTVKLLSLPCNEEKDALQILKAAHEIMDECFNQLGLEQLPNGGFKLPKNLDHPAGVSSVANMMAAKDGGYRNYTVTPGAGTKGASSVKAIYKSTIDSHFLSDGTPHTVSVQSSQGQHEKEALNILREEMEKVIPANQYGEGEKVKDVSAEVRTNYLLQVINDKIKQAKSTNGRGKVPKALKIIKESMTKCQLGTSGLAYGGKPTPADTALKHTNQANKDVARLNKALANNSQNNQLDAHKHDLEERAQRLGKKSAILRSTQSELIAERGWNRAGKMGNGALMMKSFFADLVTAPSKLWTGKHAAHYMNQRWESIGARSEAQSEYFKAMQAFMDELGIDLVAETHESFTEKFAAQGAFRQEDPDTRQEDTSTADKLNKVIQRAVERQELLYNNRSEEAQDQDPNRADINPGQGDQDHGHDNDQQHSSSPASLGPR